MSNDGRMPDDSESDNAALKEGDHERESEESNSGTRFSWSFGCGGRCMRSDGRMGRVEITQTRTRATNSDV